jgi:hypothetical protein
MADVAELDDPLEDEVDESSEDESSEDESSYPSAKVTFFVRSEEDVFFDLERRLRFDSERCLRFDLERLLLLDLERLLLFLWEEVSFERPFRSLFLSFFPRRVGTLAAPSRPMPSRGRGDPRVGNRVVEEGPVVVEGRGGWVGGVELEVGLRSSG